MKLLDGVTTTYRRGLIGRLGHSNLQALKLSIFLKLAEQLNKLLSCTPVPTCSQLSLIGFLRDTNYRIWITARIGEFRSRSFGAAANGCIDDTQFTFDTICRTDPTIARSKRTIFLPRLFVVFLTVYSLVTMMSNKTLS